MPKESSSYKTSPDPRRDRRPTYETLRRRSREPERPSGSSRHTSGASTSSYSSRNLSGGDSVKTGGRPQNGHLNGRRHAEDGAITTASRRGGPTDDALSAYEPSTSRAEEKKRVAASSRGGGSTNDAAACEPSVSREEEKKRRETYTKHLILKKRGFPLLYPHPDIALGDVGILTYSGAFDILFNILRPPDHPKNRDRAPPGFVPFAPKGSRKVEYRSNAFIASAEIKRTADATGASVFEAGKSSDGAILATPGGVECEDLDEDEDIPALRDYVAARLEGWYRSAQVRNGDLRVVIGVDRANAPWGVAVFPSVPQGSRFKFHPVGRGASASSAAQEAYTWQRSSPGHFREGTNSAGVFVRTLNPKLKESATPVAPPEVPHPSEDINMRLLKWSPSSKVVISEDHNWCSILSSKEPAFPPNDKMWGRFSEAYLPVLADNGLLFLEPVAPPSQSSGSTYSPITDNNILECLPIERPRRGKCTPKHFADVHDRSYMEARKFKHSGFARYAALLPPLHREYRPLPAPLPLSDAPYAVHQALFGRLEMLEAVLGFVYATWNKERSSPRGLDDMEWAQMRTFIDWCRIKWDGATYGDAERAFLGLMHMLDTFIQAKLMHRFMEKRLSLPISILHTDLCTSIRELAPSESSQLAPSLVAPSPAAATPADNAPTPSNADTPRQSNSSTHLPRPSLSTSNQSTPTKVNATPIRTSQSHNLEVPKVKFTSSVSPSPSTSTPRCMSPHPSFKSPSKPGTQLPVPYTDILEELQKPKTNTAIPSSLADAMNLVTHPVGPSLLANVLTFASKNKHANASSHLARETLSLPVLFRSFPRTWRRVVYTALGPGDEHEPDFDDDEGGLYWPDHPLNGQGIGWVCLVGKAMVKEFGTPFGYQGLAGVLVKPDK